MSTQEVSAEPDLPDTAWVRFLRAHAALTRELSSRLEAVHELTLSDFDVLVQLYYADGRRMRRIDLARSVLLTASGITRLLDGLESAGLVAKERCDSDARVTYAVLTAAGIKKIEEARDSHLADIEELFGSRFSPDERDQLAELLGRLPLAHTAEPCSA
ncbi:MAG TPA: MarR family transcriptional regulator [Gaiellaceae bacterium]|nr:MarR family transcriptional regulator [Gaiellaceae bacterium]